MRASTPPIRQNAWVVEDIDRAAADWSLNFQIGPFFCLRHLEIEAARYRGRPVALDISVALCFSGELCIELIEQHSPGPSAYRDVAPEGSRAFHHVLVYPTNYEAELRRYRAAGLEVAAEGVVKASGLEFAYVDARATLGCMVELASRDNLAQWRPLMDAAWEWRPGDAATREIARLA